MPRPRVDDLEGWIKIASLLSMAYLPTPLTRRITARPDGCLSFYVFYGQCWDSDLMGLRRTGASIQFTVPMRLLLTNEASGVSLEQQAANFLL